MDLRAIGDLWFLVVFGVVVAALSAGVFFIALRFLQGRHRHLASALLGAFLVPGLILVLALPASIAIDPSGESVDARGMLLISVAAMAAMAAPVASLIGVLLGCASWWMATRTARRGR